MSADDQRPPNGSNAAWREFLEVYEPLRPELYRYCRYLSRTPWDAEDLVQDTLARAFMAPGPSSGARTQPRAWLFRIASNHWINQIRGQREDLISPLERSAQSDPRPTREAVGSLIAQLAPQERAAVVLKEAFDFSLEEISETLSTTLGAVKAALHRGRGKLANPDEHRPAPAPEVLTAFCDAFNARDIDALTRLLLEAVVVVFPGIHTEQGVSGARRALATALLDTPDEDTRGIAPEWRVGLLGAPPRAELRQHRGESLILYFFQHSDGEAVRAFSRMNAQGDRIAGIRMYFHTPEAIMELCRELELPCRTNGHRSWW